MTVFLSGIQPSDCKLHLGNYIGAILNSKNIAKSLHKDDKFYFMIADLHAMTSIHESNVLKENIKRLAATYIACGIEPDFEKIFIFQQSRVSAHCELCWILSTITSIGQLERMTQFKDKKGKSSVNDINAGLLFYPVLMVADIILYKANSILVGDDQTQHLEFTRDTVQKFMKTFGNYNDDSIFVMPDKITTEESKRIMSLGDGTKKMSKSVGDNKDKIFLTDTDEEIEKKIKTAKTDSIIGIYYDKENRPEISNLINIFSAISKKSIQEINNEYCEKNTKTFKDDLIQLLIKEIKPIREKYNDLIKESLYLEDILNKSNKIANEVANDTLMKVKKVIGLI